MVNETFTTLAFSIGKRTPEFESQTSVFSVFLEDPFLISLVLGVIGFIALAIGWKVPNLRKITYSVFGVMLGLAVIIYAVGTLITTERERVLARQALLVEACYPDPHPDWNTLAELTDEQLELKVTKLSKKGRDDSFDMIKRYLDLRDPPRFRTLYSDVNINGNQAESRLRVETSVNTDGQRTGVFTSEWRILWKKTSDKWIITKIELLAVQTNASELKNLDPG